MTRVGVEDEDGGANDGTRLRVLVTGAEGLVGSVVRARLSDRHDLRALTLGPADFPSHVADVADIAAIEPAFAGVDAVVHLAADASVEATWGSVLRSNIIGTYNVLEAARRAGVRRVVLASSNHVVGMYEVENAPEVYELDDERSWGTGAEIRPDSLYGVSKAFGEALGRQYHDRYGLEVICLRIGWVNRADDPLAVQAGRPFEPLPELDAEQARKRARAVWLSHRDAAHLVDRALTARVGWAVVYGVSANPRLLWDLAAARELLGYKPRDSAPV